MTTTTTARHTTHSRLPFAPLSGVGLMNAYNDAMAEWNALSRLYPFECFPLETMTERLREHNEAHPDLYAASVRATRFQIAIEDRLDR